MSTMNELQQREVELECAMKQRAMKQRGGARVTDEKELHAVGAKLEGLTDHAGPTSEVSVQELRCSLGDFVTAESLPARFRK